MQYIHYIIIYYAYALILTLICFDTAGSFSKNFFFKFSLWVLPQSFLSFSEGDSENEVSHFVSCPPRQQYMHSVVSQGCSGRYIFSFLNIESQLLFTGSRQHPKEYKRHDSRTNRRCPSWRSYCRHADDYILWSLCIIANPPATTASFFHATTLCSGLRSQQQQ